MPKVLAADQKPRTSPPKRFWLFGGDQFYPSGGLEDFRQSFYSLEEEAVAAATTQEFATSDYPDQFWKLDWWSVFDSQTLSVVDSGGQFFGGNPPTNVYLNEVQSKVLPESRED